MEINVYPEKEIWDQAREQAEELLNQLPEVKEPPALPSYRPKLNYRNKE